jgi:hypothetical protein
VRIALKKLRAVIREELQHISEEVSLSNVGRDLTDTQLKALDPDVLADYLLERGLIDAPEDSDPEVAAKRLRWLAKSWGTPIHEAIRDVDWHKNTYNFARAILRDLPHYNQIEVAVTCIREVLYEVSSDGDDRPRETFTAIEGWLKNPCRETVTRVRDAMGGIAYAAEANSEADAAVYYVAEAIYARSIGSLNTAIAEVAEALGGADIREIILEAALNACLY